MKWKRAFDDRGYLTGGTVEVLVAGQYRGITEALRKKLKRRNAIEPIIGHMKTEGHLDRNYLKGTLGDTINAVLAGAGQNLRMILEPLGVLLLRWILEILSMPPRG